MSFIKIKIGGVERGFKFDIKSTGEILKKLNCSMFSLGDEMVKNPFIVYPAILFFGAKREAEKSKKVFDHEYDDVFDWVEKDTEGIMGDSVMKVIGCFSDSVVSLLPEIKKEQVVPNVKKKSTGKKT